MVKRRRKQNSTTIMWASIGGVVVVVAAIVLATTLTASGPDKAFFGAASPALLSEVENVPASVFNAVGITSPAITVTPLSFSKSQPPLTFTVGKAKLPGFLYVGAEYCPYCAATRWGMIIALARFGHFNRLYDMLSSSTDYAPSTPTFSFVGKLPSSVVTYTSRYLAFVPFEQLNRNKQALMTPSAQADRLVSLYDQGTGIPFVDMNNHWFLTGSAYDPADLANLSRDSIAAGLTDPTIPVTQAIITTANYISSGICAMTHSQPAAVCHSSGVEAAAKALKIKL